VRAAVLTVSDGVYWDEREDESGRVLAELAGEAGFDVPYRATVPDERSQIAERVMGWCDGAADVALVLVTGGTGFAPRDVTPEALAPLYHRRAPGLDEAMRAASLQAAPHGMLTRGVSGVRGRTLVLSFPGSPKACRENFAVVRPVLDHALRLLREVPTAHL
jgi:molybdenum cofactor synthesis domain-containing protein